MSHVIYEQPLNENIRAYLRLEQQFNSMLHHAQGGSEWSDRAVVNDILQLSNLLDRPDLRSKLAKEIGRQLEALLPHRGDPCVEQEGLHALIQELETLQQKLYAHEGRFGQNVRENEFLTSIRQYLYNPGGACHFDSPAYYNWLHAYPERRQQDIQRWLSEFEIVRQAVGLLLQLVRDSAEPQEKLAPLGFFQEVLDPRTVCPLIRVIVRQEDGVFPEISSGRHRVTIRFNQARHGGERPAQTEKDVPFQVVYCLG